MDQIPKPKLPTDENATPHIATNFGKSGIVRETISPLDICSGTKMSCVG